jgi:hypothetical protein
VAQIRSILNFDLPVPVRGRPWRHRKRCCNRRRSLSGTCRTADFLGLFRLGNESVKVDASAWLGSRFGLCRPVSRAAHIERMRSSSPMGKAWWPLGGLGAICVCLSGIPSSPGSQAESFLAQVHLLSTRRSDAVFRQNQVKTCTTTQQDHVIPRVIHPILS